MHATTPIASLGQEAEREVNAMRRDAEARVLAESAQFLGQISQVAVPFSPAVGWNMPWINMLGVRKKTPT